MRELVWLCATLIGASPLLSAPAHVEVTALAPGKFALYRDGKPFFVRGAGGADRFDRLADCGANSIRTWGSDQTAVVIDEAGRRGLTVCAGIWIEHQRHGFDYDDAAAVRTQIEKHCREVDRFKDHPALLLWSVGNEVETGADNPKVWDAIEAVAAYIKQVDPHHPVMTVTAHISAKVAAEIIRRCPSIDLLGTNCYAGIRVIARDVRAAGWTKPYLVTEWGNDGYWEVPKTTWGAELEPTSTEKAVQRRDRYAYVLADSDRCLGAYAFYWGQKQEITQTWFNLFLEDGSETESIDVLRMLWSGQPATEHTPRISALRLNGSAAVESLRVEPEAIMKAEFSLTRGDLADVVVTWELLPESNTKRAGGDAESRPVNTALQTVAGRPGTQLTFKAPAAPGAYRLFLTVRGPARTAASANFPFLVAPR